MGRPMVFDAPVAAGESDGRPCSFWRGCSHHLQSSHEGGLDVFMVSVSPARTTVGVEDRVERISQRDSRIRLGHSGECRGRLVSTWGGLTYRFKARGVERDALLQPFPRPVLVR